MSNAGGQGDAKDLYINQLMREIKELKLNDNDYKNIATTVSNLEKRYAQLRSEKAQSEHSNAKKHDELVERLATMRTKIDDYRSRIQEKENECKNLSEDIEGGQRLFTSKKQSVDQLTFELDDLINKRSQLESEVAQLKNTHARVLAEREEYFTNIQLGNRKLDDLFKADKQLEEENSELEARIESKKRSIDALNNNVGECEREIEQVRADIDDKEADCCEVEKIIISLTAKIDNEKRSRDLEKSELDTSNVEFTKLLNQINDLQLTLQKAQGKLRNKEKKLEEKKQETHTVETKADGLKTRNEEIEEQIEVLKNNIEKTIALCKEVSFQLPSTSESSKRSTQMTRRSDRDLTEEEKLRT
jgi:chromosome segregation ATPase